jgi:hypothetical protein
LITLIFWVDFASITAMSPEEKELFKRSIALAEENNDILRSIQRSIRLNRLMSILYWVVIIGASVGAYYLVQPYLTQAISVYNQAKSSLDNGVTGVMDKFK